MNLIQILDYLQHPSKLGTANLDDLNRLSDEFPYCHISHILLTKALHDQKDMGYHARLKKTAIHIPDRSVLYWLTAGRARPDDVVMMPDREPGPTSGIKVPKIVMPAIPAEKEKKSTFDSIMARLEELGRIPLPRYEEMEVKISEVQKAHEQRLEKIIRDFREELERILRPAPPDNEIPAPDKVSEPEPPANSDNTETTALSAEISETETHKKPDARDDKKEIIERFITEKPVITRPKKDFFDPVNMAHKSTEDPGDLVSETLAEIHLKQGNIEKALNIYAKLILLIPEKSAYFAARIEKIKKENNLL